MCASLSSFSEISFSKEFIYITFDMRVDCRDFDKSRSKKLSLDVINCLRQSDSRESTSIRFFDSDSIMIKITPTCH